VVWLDLFVLMFSCIWVFSLVCYSLSGLGGLDVCIIGIIGFGVFLVVFCVFLLLCDCCV